MLVATLIIICLCLASALVFVSYHAIKWAKIIFMLEDDLSEAIEVHERTIMVLDKITKTQMFFDSPEVKVVVDEALSDVRDCRTATHRLVKVFTDRSKQRYIRTEKDTGRGNNDISDI